LPLSVFDVRCSMSSRTGGRPSAPHPIRCEASAGSGWASGGEGRQAAVPAGRLAPRMFEMFEPMFVVAVVGLEKKKLTVYLL
jgi:hypothetical protein